MEAVLTSFYFLLLMIVLLGSGIWIFAGMLLASLIGLMLFLDIPLPMIGAIMVKRMYSGAGSWEIACIPLFMWMGELLFRTDVSERLFKGLSFLLDKLPGRLLHVNVAGCALFAAVSGSSTATVATIGKITVDELKSRSYSTNLSIGSLAGAGTFGLMIPPSIVLIIYGVLAEESISKLFLAGILPGLLLAFLYSFYLMIRSLINPGLAPSVTSQRNFFQYIQSILLLVPVLILICIVLGSIYSGLATPTEAAAVGVVASLVMTLILRQLTWEVFLDSLLGALKNSCMVCSLLAGAAVMSTAMGLLHVPQDISTAISGLHLTPYSLMVVLGIFYIILGFFLDGISITVMSLPICLPLILEAGFDPIWFGIFLVAMTELAQITPPVGFNLFVLQGMTGHSIGKVAYAAFPFFLLMVFGVVIITIFPDIALFLPKWIFGT
ncbi:MAG: TRAP transporter large permease subunit [Desulfohalobiaceae bacterium]|nr:TRAP transporter large permease subunit [Desulfohalobiaceae bacterium]